MIRRTNMVFRKTETWRPPLFTASNGWFDQLQFAARRFLDLQTASIWNDLSLELPAVRGAVLDVGCGAQPYRSLFRPDVRYLGIDTADARAHFGYEVPDTRYFEGNVWPVSDSSINFILCTEALEHVTNPTQFLAEGARCLIPGGRILLTVPFSARWHYIPFDYWRFTPSSLNNLLAANGFRGIEVYARGNEITVACYKAMALFLPLLMSQERRGLRTVCFRVLGILFSPIFFCLALAGNLSLRGRGGDDCLGYTVIAQKPESA